MSTATTPQWESEYDAERQQQQRQAPIHADEDVATRRQAHDADVEAMYAAYRATVAQTATASTGETSATHAAMVAPSIAMIPLPRELEPLLGNKFGQWLHAAEVGEVAFKGFFGKSMQKCVIVITPHYFYAATLSNGKVVLGIALQRIKSLHAWTGGSHAVGLRTAEGGQVYFTLPTIAGRATLVDAIVVLKKPDRDFRSCVGADKSLESAFLKDTTFLDEDKVEWECKEDPRVGGAFVTIPEAVREMFSPLVPKPLFWFNPSVEQHVKNNRGSVVTVRRAGWMTPTAFFLSEVTGPKLDGSAIRRCVGIEYIRNVIVQSGSSGGGGGTMAICCPGQPDLLLTLSSVEERDFVVMLLFRCFQFRTHQPLYIIQELGSDMHRVVQVADESHHRPTLFVMQPAAELYKLLRHTTTAVQ